MTTQKDFKRVVRARMQKTGESYTAARAHVVGRGQRAEGRAGAAPQAPVIVPTSVPVADYPRLAGQSDETIKAKTGCTWEKWVWALDHVNAHRWPHREIARYVQEKYEVPGWWAQAVTVGYERIRGLREKGQRRGGSWEASKSRTIGAGVSTVFRAVKEPKRRRAWLGDVEAVVRTSVPNKSVRLTWEDGSSVEVYLVSKGRSKAQVTVQHTKLPSREMRERLKDYWADRLDVLAETLAPAS
jgi:uncharacterized protein YndB with AHSA1/START domain